MYIWMTYSYTLRPSKSTRDTWPWCSTNCVKPSFTSAETKSTSTPRGWTVLGILSDVRIHADADKMQKIRDWRQPHNYHEIQWFLGLVQYLAHFMPDITAYTSPLTGYV